MVMTAKPFMGYLPTIGASLLMLALATSCGESCDAGSTPDDAGSVEDAADTTAPSVSSSVPLNDATGVAFGSNMVVTFSEAMDPSTLTSTTFILMHETNAIAGSVSYSGVTATFNPTSALGSSTTYTATVTTGATDLAGNALAAAYVWSFTTTATADSTAPTVVSTIPAAEALVAATRRGISVDFSEAMQPSTLSTATFTLVGPGTTSVAGAVTYSGTRATFTPLSALAINTPFLATITTGATDLASNALASDYEWSFNTNASSAQGPHPVLLGTAGAFVILAKSGIDTVPTSAVTGDIGVSPIDSTALTGFSLSVDASNVFASSDQVTGQVFAPDYSSPTPANLTTAISDMETAYTDAAGRATPDFTELGEGEIGGLTLVPGLYKWGTGVAISTDVILDGGPNDVWIFQIAGDVTQANGTNVTLSGGASPHNIFWQTFGQLRVGTTAHFEGVVLCQTAIVLGTGASVNGRLLAQTAVTLNQNAVTQPAVPSP